MEPGNSLLHLQKLPTVRTLIQSNPVYASPYYWQNIRLILSSHLSLDIPVSLFVSGFTTKNL